MNLVRVHIDHVTIIVQSDPIPMNIIASYMKNMRHVFGL